MLSFVGTPVMILPNGPAPSNKKLVDLAEKLKPLIRDLIDHANMVKFCMTYVTMLTDYEQTDEISLIS